VKGDYRELAIREGTMPDGAGGEKRATIIRLWVDDADEDPDDVLVLELSYASEGGHVPDVHELISSVLRVWEIEP
jgi:hypothetical protein